LNKRRIYINNKGQALLFVVVALTISMVVGVSVATRTLSMTKRVSSTDTLAKVYYAAEAGIERFVSRPVSELAAMVAGGNCGNTSSTWSSAEGACIFTLGDTSEIATDTSVTVDLVSANESDPERYEIRLKNGAFSGIAMSGYSGNQVTLCWADSNNASNTALYYTLWSSDALLRENLVLPNAVAPSPDAVTFTVTGTPVTAAVSPHAMYDWCANISTAGTPYFMNVMSLGGDATVGVLPALGFTIPPQGFQIVSRATLSSDDDNPQVVTVIRVSRSYDHVPGFFNSAIYSQKDIVAN